MKSQEILCVHWKFQYDGRQIWDQMWNKTPFFNISLAIKVSSYLYLNLYKCGCICLQSRTKRGLPYLLVFSCFVFFLHPSVDLQLWEYYWHLKHTLFRNKLSIFFFPQICWRSTQTCYYVTLLKIGRFWMEFYNLPWSIEQCIYLPRFFPFTHLWLLTTNMTRSIWQFFINFRIHFKFAQKWSMISTYLIFIFSWKISASMTFELAPQP